MEDRGSAPLIGDLDRQTSFRDRHLYEDRQLRLVVVAVLHGVHRRLGHGGLEPLERPLGQPQPAHRPGHLLRSPTLVTELAGYAQLGERPTGAAPGCRHSSSDLSIVTSAVSSSTGSRYHARI